MRKTVLIITCEMLPLPGKPVCGGGIRVWGLGNGIAQAGHKVIYSLPAELVADDESLPDSIRVNAHEPEKLNERILEVMPDLVIVEQWGLATYLGDLNIPLAIDLHGPLTLENAFKEGGNFLSDALTKIDALAKADFLICPGHLQKRYFYTWFLMAGADPRDANLVVVPVGMPEAQPKKKKAKKPLLVYGGVTWPWIDPFPGLEIAGKLVGQNKNAGFELYIQKPPLHNTHPLYAINRNILKSYDERLSGRDGVKIKDFIPHDDLINRYTQATAAFDLYQPNHERELAVTTRTVEYMWAGLPVIYARYAELARSIEQYDAGWLVDPNDETGIEQAVREALEKPEISAKKSKNAQKLVAERFTWSASVKELLPLVEKPPTRKRTGTLLSGIRDYYRNESVEEILEGKNKLAELNDEIRHLMMESEKEKRDRDRRIEELGEQVREVIFEKDRQIRDLMAEHRKELDKKDDELKRLLEKLDNETHTRDQEIQRLHKDRQLSESKLQDEIARLNKEKENDRRESQAEIARINDRRTEELAEIKKAKEIESEKHLAEIKKLHEQLTLDAKKQSEQLKQINEEKQKIREEAARELKKAIETKDKAFTDLKKTNEKETARLQARIDKLTEKTEAAKKELTDEISSLNREKEQTRKSHEQEIKKLNAQFESQLGKVRDQHDKKMARYEEKLEAEIEKRNRLERELQEEIRSLNRLREEDQRRFSERTEKLQERHEEEMRKASDQAAREIERREKILDRHGEKIAEVETEWRGKVAAKDKDIDTLRSQLDDLNAQITSRLTELDRIAAEKEIYVRESEKRFALLEEKITAQAREVTVKSDELTAANAALAQADQNAKNLTAAMESLKEDFARVSRHAENLETEIPALRKRTELAEREVESFRERPGMKAKNRRAKRSRRLFFQLPRLAFLWSVNLVTNTYMELWQKRTGRRLFPGTKKEKKKGSEDTV